MGRSRMLLTVAATVLAACQPPRSSQVSSDAEGGGECIRGEVGVLPAPSSMVALKAGGDTYVVAAGATTIPASLEGAVVDACGRIAARPSGGAGRFKVDSFRLDSIGGLPAVLGILRVDEERVLLVEGDRTWRLRGPIEALRSRDGARVWVSGRIEGDGIRVESYGLVD